MLQEIFMYLLPPVAIVWEVLLKGVTVGLILVALVYIASANILKN